MTPCTHHPDQDATHFLTIAVLPLNGRPGHLPMRLTVCKACAKELRAGPLQLFAGSNAFTFPRFETLEELDTKTQPKRESPGC